MTSSEVVRRAIIYGVVKDGLDAAKAIGWNGML